jgi:hypothetical protein
MMSNHGREDAMEHEMAETETWTKWREENEDTDDDDSSSIPLCLQRSSTMMPRRQLPSANDHSVPVQAIDRDVCMTNHVPEPVENSQRVRVYNMCLLYTLFLLLLAMGMYLMLTSVKHLT